MFVFSSHEFSCTKGVTIAECRLQTTNKSTQHSLMITAVSIGEKFDVQHVVKDRFMHITRRNV
jgi:hypothetical protein